MAEYIEREALIKRIRLLPRFAPYNTVRYSSVQNVIFDAPIADVVEVVRCKDCKYFLHDTDYCQEHNAGYCAFDDTIKARLHFCGLGIRKEGAEE